MAIRNIGVVGAGTMGNGIAQIFAQNGFDVVMCDIDLAFAEKGKATVAKNFDRLVAKGKMTAADKDAALGRIRLTTDLEEMAGRDMMIEAVVEIYEVKAELLGKLDEICGDEIVLATNTSSISVTKIAAASRVPSRVVGMHFFNPVPVMRLVEIIRGLQTSDLTCHTIEAVCRELGKVPHMVKDNYGFVANRILVLMINEAINCYYEGLSDAHEVDDIMKLGANHPMGPLSLADLIGLDVCLKIMETLYTGFDDPKYRPSPLLKQMVDAGYLGRKTGRGFFRYET